MIAALHFFPLIHGCMKKDPFNDEAHQALMDHDYELVREITGQSGIQTFHPDDGEEIQDGYYLALFDGHYTVVEINGIMFNAFGCMGLVKDLMCKFELIGPITPAGMYELFKREV